MANKIFKGVKFPGMDDYYVLPEAVITKNEDGIIEIESYMPGESNIVIDKTLSTSGAVAEAKAVGDALQNKVSVVEGSRLMTAEEANKLAKLVIDEDGNVGSTDIINVGNAEGILAIAHGGTGATTASAALTNLGAAPAGYGIGSSSKSIGDANDALTGGIYYYGSDASNIPNGFGAGVIFVQNRADAQIFQRISDIYGLVAERIRQSNGTWGDWIDVSPSAFAPAKFGLNNDFVTTTNAADFDGYKTNGWYRYVNNNAQTLVPDFNVYYAVVRVDSYADNDYIVQTMYPMNYPSCTLQRYYHLSYGTWSKWAWENPPLNNDVEYFTTELIKNVQIYKKKDSATGKIQYRIAGEGTWNDYAGLLGQTDYVVANGTSGVWSYWKFNSGLCIAMGTPTVTWGTYTSLTTGQYRSGTALDLTGIFTAVMGGSCSNVHRFVNCFVIPSGSTSAELWATSAANASGNLTGFDTTPHVVLFGKWK